MNAVVEVYMKEEIENNKSGACAGCDKDCQAKQKRPGESDEDFERRMLLQSRMCRIQHKIVVLSGKGGVGKSTVAVNLAMALKMAGMRVGLLDIDLHGPSVPTMLGLEGERLQGGPDGIIPIDKDGIKIISIGFLLSNIDDAVIWRGPRKMGAIQQFLSDVDWGDLDYLIIDTPPGTGDEQLSLCQLVEGLEGAVVVTTPQKVASSDVRKSINFCRHLELPVLGVVENMSGFVCPKCGEVTDMFCSGGGSETAKEMDVSFLGKIPLDPKVAMACDNGKAFISEFARSPTAECMSDIIQALGLKYG
ncbi:MAG: Mrp/NBP35 family ATP-binding protein [Kiritimatiellia bacterium]